jgi:Tfp pilus assembly protein PilV
MKLLRSARVFLRAHRNGQSLIEVLVALAIGVAFIVAAASIIAPALRVNTQAGTEQAVASLSQELSDNIRTWKSSGWANIAALATSSANTYYLNTSASPFTAVSGKESITVGSSTYQRYFYVSDVYRDTSGNVTSTTGNCSGSSPCYDPSTKQITVTAQAVSYDGTLGNWTSTTALPGILAFQGGVVYNGRIYTTGGSTASCCAAVTTVYYSAQISATGSISNWSSTQALPVGLLSDAAVVNNGYVYTTGGGDASPFAYANAYYAKFSSNGSISNWSSTTALPGAVREDSAVVYNGYIYSLGGRDINQVTTATVNFAPINSDGSIGTWASTTALPSSLNGQSALVYNGYIYTVGGGSLGSDTSTVFYAPINSNGSIGTWATTTALPKKLSFHSAIVSNGYIYTTGGGSSNSTATVQYAPINANGTIGAWSNTTALPSAISMLSAVVYNGYIYTTGGVNLPSNNVTSSVFYAKLNSTTGPSQTTSFYVTRNSNNALAYTDWSGGPTISGTGVWNTTQPLGGATGGAAGLSRQAAVVNNGYIYSTGGYDGTNTSSTVQYAPINSNGTIGSWSNTTALPSPMDRHAAVVYNNYVYTIGGDPNNFGSGSPTSTVQYAPINSTGSIGTWSNTTALPVATQDHASVAYNGYLYRIAGCGANDCIDTSTVQYAPFNSTGSIGSWTNTTALPSIMAREGAVAYNGYMYSIGGTSGSKTSTVFYAPINSNGTIGAWSNTTALLSAIADQAVGVNNGYLYSAGGYDGTNPTSTVQYAPINSNGTIGAWSYTNVLPTTLLDDASAIANGYVYTIGGCTVPNCSSPTSSVFYAQLGNPLTVTSVTNQFTTSTNINYASTTGAISLALAGSGNISLVQVKNSTSAVATTNTTLAPTAAGDAIVVAVQIGAAGGVSVTGAGDNMGDKFVSAGVKVSSGNFLSTTEIWYTTSTSAGVTNVSATISSNQYMGAWVYEVSGLNASAMLDATGRVNVSTASTTITGPSLTTTWPSEFLVSVTALQTTSTGLQAGSAWSDDGVQFGDDSAHLITSQATTAAAVWSGAPAGGYIVSGATFRAFPTFAATGTLDSTIYDTGITTGVQLNSVLWQGTQPSGTTVQFQFAVSNSSAGPWTFMGSDGTGNTYYTVAPNTSQSLDYSLFNNFRYFKVRTTLTANGAGTLSPTVNDVIVNWSP